MKSKILLKYNFLFSKLLNLKLIKENCNNIRTFVFKRFLSQT